MSDEKSRAFLHRTGQIASLLKVDAFKRLAEEADKKEESILKVQQARLDAGERLEVLQRQIDYDRGFRDGMRYMVKAVPQGAQRILSRPEQEQESEPEEDHWDGYSP